LYLLNPQFRYFLIFLVSFGVLQVAKVHLWLILLISELKTVRRALTANLGRAMIRTR
jgi:hypothetical protein